MIIPDNVDECVDNDECVSSDCHEKAICSNTVGSYSCECNQTLWGDGKICKEGILVLHGQDKKPVVINVAGKHDEVNCLNNVHDYSLLETCSISWQNQMYIFGMRILENIHVLRLDQDATTLIVQGRGRQINNP